MSALLNSGKKRFPSLQTGLQTGVLACLLALPAATSFADGVRYQVNLAVFENRGGTETETLAADKQSIEYPDKMVELEAPATEADSAASGDFASLPVSDKEFAKVVSNLRGSSEYRVLTVTSWTQPAYGPDAAIPVRITGGDQYGIYHRLDGAVAFTTTGVLTLEADFWLGEYAPQSGATATTPAAPVADLDYDEQTAAASADVDHVPTRLLRIRNVRHMETGKLHYLDHPRLGVLVKVVELKPAKTAMSKKSATAKNKIMNPEAVE